MKDIEDRLKEEYDKVEVPDYMFDTSRVFKRAEKENNDSKKKIVSIAASIIAALLITIAIIFTMPRFLKEEEVNVEEKSENIINNVVGSVELLSKKTSADSIKSSTIFFILNDSMVFLPKSNWIDGFFPPSFIFGMQI